MYNKYKKYFISRMNINNETTRMLISKLGAVRTEALSFSEASLPAQTKSVIACIVGAEMAIFGSKFPALNGGIVAILYLYHFLLRVVGGLSSFLCSMSSETAKQIGDNLINNPVYTFGCIFFFGVIASCLILAIFKFFMRLFIFLACVFLFVEGPVRGIFMQYGVESPLPPLVLGVIMGAVLMVYFEKVARKAILIVLFSFVGCGLLFTGVGEITNNRSSIAEAIISLNPPDVPLANILKDSLLFCLTVGASILIQLFI
ncbi:hypothetical protein NEAUS03_1148 [Nematocida ausubeli]|nr:hypothetical protein NEAUS03_1148 [Nematocida ausubeli]